METAAAAHNPTIAVPGRRRSLRLPPAAMLSIGTLASGVLAYAFNLLAARALGADAYGQVAILWAAMFLVSVVAFRPVEQTLSRGIADRRARGIDARTVLTAATRLTLILCLTLTVAFALLWQPITDKLFSGSEVMSL